MLTNYTDNRERRINTLTLYFGKDSILFQKRDLPLSKLHTPLNRGCLLFIYTFCSRHLREPLHSSKRLVIYIFFIVCAPFPLVTILANNTWHACGTVPWHVGPTLLFILQNIQNGQFWLSALVWGKAHRRVHTDVCLMLDS